MKSIFSSFFHVLIALTAFAACKNRHVQTNKKETSTKNILKGTMWASAFYYYRNNYFFETDSTGFSQDGQFAWSCPIDTAAMHISGDSILYNDNDTFNYSLVDTILALHYSSLLHDSTNNTRIFHLRKYGDTIYFISDYLYSYGREGLEFKKRISNK